MPIFDSCQALVSRQKDQTKKKTMILPPRFPMSVYQTPHVFIFAQIYIASLNTLLRLSVGLLS